MTPRQMAKKLVVALKDEEANYGNQPSMGVFVAGATVTNRDGSALIKIKWQDGLDPSLTTTQSYMLSEVES